MSSETSQLSRKLTPHLPSSPYQEKNVYKRKKHSNGTSNHSTTPPTTTLTNSSPINNTSPSIQSNDKIFSYFNGFFLIPSDQFDEKSRQEVTDLIISNGNHIITDEAQLDKNNTITIIADNIDFPQYESLYERMAVTVTPQWVYDSISHGKPLPLKFYSPDPHLFFSRVLVSASGLPQGDREAIYAGVVAYGGLYNNGLTTSTTHIISNNIEEEKCQKALQFKSKNPIKIVLPHWVDDCLKFGRRVDESLYLLPDPPILRGDNDGNGGGKAGTGIASSNDEIGPFFKSDSASQSNQNTSTIFTSKRFYISQDLELSEKILLMVHKMIINSSGSIVVSVNEANVFICKYRNGDEYIQASKRSNCTVGSLDWIYWMISHKKWISPLRNLLHYPIGVKGIPGMENCLISLTNFTGHTRQFIERVIIASGAQYTNSLKKECTHLIAAKPTGRKFEAARQWKIHVINHLWLEESYALWEVQSVAIVRYIHFLPTSDLQCIVGQTQLRMKNLRQFFTQQDELMNSRTPRAASEKAKLAVHESMTKETEYQQKLKSNRRKLPPLAEENDERRPKKKRDIEGKENREEEEEEKEEDKEEEENVEAEDLEEIQIIDKKSKQNNHQLTTKINSSPLSKRSIHTNNTTTPSSSPPIPNQLNVIITSVPDIAHPSQTEEVSIHQLNDPMEADYIISPRMVRTEKFLIALANAKGVLKPGYIDACIKAGHIIWPIPNEYHLNDNNLKKALINASQFRSQGHKLFDGLSFNVTSDIKGGFSIFNRIVLAHGATSANEIPKTKTRKTKFIESTNNRSILITNEKNTTLIETFKKSPNTTTYVFTSDWVYHSILNMSLNFNDKTSAL